MLNEKQLDQIYNKCKGIKPTWDAYYHEVFAYTQPERNVIYRDGNTTPSALKQIPIYTQAGKNGTQIFVARMQNQLTPIGKPYFNFRIKDSVEPEIRQQLDNFLSHMTKRVNEYKDEINLDEVFCSAYFDLIAGTSIIMREIIGGELIYKCLPINSYMLDTERKQSVVREFTMAIGIVVQLFSELQGMEID